jgi:hypothetical protein
MTASGVTSIPLELYLDSQDRPVQVTENLTVQGQRVTSKNVISKYDEPVSISAPPPGQVGN